MRVTVRAIVFPAIIFVILVVAPSVLIGLVPPEAVEMMRKAVQVDLPGMVMVVAGLGVALAALSFVKNAWERWSWVHLGSSLASVAGWLFLWLFLLGVGDPGCLGQITKSLGAALPIEVEAAVTVDLRFFAFFLILIAGLAVVKTLLTFNAARRSRSKPPPLPIHPPQEKPIE